MKDKKEAKFEPHADDLKTFARRIFPLIKAYYESEGGQNEWEEWKERQERR